MEEAYAATARHYTIKDYEFAPKILGVDVARYGGDRSVIFPRQGLVAFKPKVFQGINNMDFAGQVAQAIDHWGADAVFVDAGRGEGVIDRLRQDMEDAATQVFLAPAHPIHRPYAAQ